MRQLLTHTSGLPAWADIWSRSPQGALLRAVQDRAGARPRRAGEYSDIGFVGLWAAAERAAGEPLPELLERRVWRPLGMKHTRFAPGEGCGVAGNAGLFATAHDVARFAAMLSNRGELAGVRVLRAETVAEFTRRQPGAGSRALGWDTPGRNVVPSGLHTCPDSRDVELRSFQSTYQTRTAIPELWALSSSAGMVLPPKVVSNAKFSRSAMAFSSSRLPCSQARLFASAGPIPGFAFRTRRVASSGLK